MGGCLLLGRGQYEQYETSTKPVRKSSEGRAKKQIVPYGTYSYEDLFLNVHVLSPRDDGVLGVMFARARLPARAYGMLSVGACNVFARLRGDGGIGIWGRG